MVRKQCETSEGDVIRPIFQTVGFYPQAAASSSYSSLLYLSACKALTENKLLRFRLRFARVSDTSRHADGYISPC